MRIWCLLFVFIASISSFAQNVKIKELEQRRKDTQLDISTTNELLKQIKRTTNTLLSRIQLISNQLVSRQESLAFLEQEIKVIGGEQKQIEDEITILEADLKSKQESYAKAVEGMLQNRRGEDKLLFVLSGKSLTESYRRLRYLNDYTDWRKAQATAIEEKSAKLKETKEALAGMKAEKSALLAQRTTEQENLKQEESNYKDEVDEARTKQKDLQIELDRKRLQAEALDKQIARLIAQEVARQELEAKRIAERKARTTTKKTTKGNTSPAEEETETAATPENATLSQNFASNKGKLPYPVTGRYTITTHFGSHRRDRFITMASDGINIQSQSGAEAKSVFNGEVTYVAAIPGYNNCIIIRHGNYYSFYGNIQNIYVKQGDEVKTGQSLGKVYTDPDTGLSEMHFQLRQGINKLDPETWLRR
jgi:septal ring factor EnvC (AmiA/AmiB activator)